MMRVLISGLIIFCVAQGTCAQRSGVVLKTDHASPGYTLIAPFGGNSTFLIDLDGKVVHRWNSRTEPAHAAYLLEDGSLLRTAKVPNPVFNVIGGPAGGVQRYSWEGDLLWDFTYSSETYLAHHDIEPLPNGNVLLVAWELKTAEQAVAAGRDPSTIVGGSLWPEVVLEVEPVGPTEGRIVWEWHLWDHVVQSFDANKPNYGDPAEHPELVDLNLSSPPDRDWIHMNSIDYHPGLDQIMLCGRTFDEVWIIDHSTTTQEAAGHTGGRAGRGGDLLYRWGNPYTYFAGLPDDQKLFGQHDLHWIPARLPGAGHILVFNNGSFHENRPYSSVDEIAPPLRNDGTYAREEGLAFGPPQALWSYADPDRFYSSRISGAQRLPNGNTLICAGEQVRVFEVDPEGNLVWDYRNTLGGRPGEGDEAYEDSQAPGQLPPLGGRAMFRAVRYASDHPAFSGRTLRPEE